MWVLCLVPNSRLQAAQLEELDRAIKANLSKKNTGLEQLVRQVCAWRCDCAVPCAVTVLRLCCDYAVTVLVRQVCAWRCDCAVG